MNKQYSNSPSLYQHKEEVLERLVNRRVVEVVEYLRDESRVEQVQDRVLGTADVEIDPAHVVFRRVERLLAARTRPARRALPFRDHPVALRLMGDEALAIRR